MPYPNVKFPPYEFREYPKYVTPEGGEPVLVNDPGEEAAVLAPAKRPPGRKAAE